MQRPMDSVELVIFFLLIAVAVFGAGARVLDVPYPIALVVGGSLVGFARRARGGAGDEDENLDDRSHD